MIKMITNDDDENVLMTSLPVLIVILCIYYSLFTNLLMKIRPSITSMNLESL